MGMLVAGETALVVDIEGQVELVHRLHEMGLRPGRHVRMIRPGKTCIVAVENHRFGFRGDEAAHVLVEPAMGAGEQEVE
jgi:Fe2+ transport system protein FeoA